MRELLRRPGRVALGLLLLALSAAAPLAGEPGAMDPTDDDGFEDCVMEFPLGPDGEPLMPTAHAVGPRTVLALIVDFQDATVAGTLTADPVGFVSGVLYDNTQNSAGMIADGSWGLTTLVNDADGDLAHDIFVVDIAHNIVGQPCSTTTWANAADEQAEMAGIDLGLYQHRMYVLPQVSGCGWSGLGQVGGSRTWIRTTRATTYAHELGHNFGMGHASTDPENDGTVNSTYGDLSDIMGSSSIWRTFNAPHKRQMNWLPESAIHDLFGGGTQVFTIEALEIDPAAAIQPQAIRIQRAYNLGRPFYLSYRSPIGYDNTMSSTYLNRLQIHNHTGTSSSTHYIRGLNDSESFSDPGANSLVITQLSHDATTVTIEITRTEPDLDGDGFGETVDCDDYDDTIYPGAPELCDHVDNDCDGDIDEGFPACDEDGDGYDDSVDCDDNDPLINPGVVEICDFVDNNCDGDIDEPDYDGDGRGNCNDACPLDPNKGASFFWCECGVPEDSDSDNDTVPDCADACPDDPDNIGPDSDNDGFSDCIDQCPNDPEKWNPLWAGDCPCGVPNVDNDGDGVWNCHDRCAHDDDTIDLDLDGRPDCNEACDNDPWKGQPGLCGCGVAEIDTDGDLECDPVDNCPNVPNPSQTDLDEDGVGYACDCDPLDPGATMSIGPASDLTFTTKTDFSWIAPVDTGGGTLSFDVLRSADGSDFETPDCPESGIAATTASDSDPPSPLYFYLIRVVGACGDNMGMALPEVRRSGGPCP